MKVLIIGSGGREHAIADAIVKGDKAAKIYCAPGNGGIASVAECVPIWVMDFDKLADFAQENQIDITIVGMDGPLVGGIVDVFESRKLKIFGPRKNAAILEGSKVFSKNLMKKYGIPTASYETFDNYDDAIDYIENHKMPVVIKADGLALGKGVLICQDKEQALAGIKDMMVGKKFNEAGSKIVIEEFLSGPETSLLCFCDGKTIVPMVTAQDYKRARDNNEGLNTGGMGSISPSPVMTEDMLKDVYENICLPSLKAMLNEGREFKGVMYIGLMLTEDGVKVLEYNARFGDPETQVILPRLKSDFLEIILAVENGTLNKLKIEWEDNAACCVVLASGGYPEEYKSGYVIKGIEEATKTAMVYHAGTKLGEDCFITSGGRVLGVTGLGSNLEAARQTAYEAASKIEFDDMYFRTDIGKA